MSTKKIYTCDLCGKTYNPKKYWTLECDTFFIDTYSDNRKVVLDICGECAKWIKKQKGKVEP